MACLSLQLLAIMLIHTLRNDQLSLSPAHYCRGEYTGATNTEDDYAVREHAPPRKMCVGCYTTYRCDANLLSAALP